MRQSVFVSAAVLSIAGFLCFASDARAQDAAPAPAGAPAAPAAGAPQADTHANAAGDDKEEGRLRIGFNFLNVGVGSAGNLSGPFIGATFKIGWQFNRLMGLYGNITPFVWIGSNSAASAAGVDIGAIAGTQLTPLFSLTPADIFEVAAGPSLDYLSGGGASSSATGGATAGAFSGVYFGVHGKVALHLGGRNEETGRRRGFTIEGNVHPSFTPGDAALFLTGGLGYDWM
ncbi:MAG: hypothetical protein JWP87_6351 [Labilithrix sp.]|jgi:hypothetical protein|nr:hypothetical protein [Labilithrix sp.]